MTNQIFNSKLSNRRKILIGLVITLLTLNLLQLYLNSDDTTRLQERVQSKNVELALTYTKLDSISSELNKQIQILKLLNEETESLQKVKENLEKEKRELRSNQLLEEYRYNEIRKKVSMYEELLAQKDKKITSLKHVNDSLISENFHLKEEKTSLTSKINNLKNHQGELEKELHKAKRLIAFDIHTLGGDKKGNFTRGNKFKMKKTDQIIVQFKVSKNEVVEAGNKQVFLCLVDPDGATIYNPNNTTRFFKLEDNGENIFYTSNTSFEYKNDEKIVQVIYDKKNLMTKGDYSAQLYCDGYFIGKTTFNIY
ncbi:hypothetical protein [Flammeovirga kamogawensis]|uniref:Chromosome partitioning protein ParA n=1 Tax=Flammeovirga kamogawensis TaxID=373891 RepID=A0ABX8GVJ0_9BACT|nr:hypothetical protein [Flammeovirga kamogawensis]MBB6459599.1 hypothetical protein [Flammeovirga kamogawensis]QWG07337.1 hypothetical protein KM029_18840 [Flammeovirga kamogawensis]TRX69154.1 hypothetical protein EO216_13840 [Flammeovirga kamogawensis]